MVCAGMRRSIRAHRSRITTRLIEERFDQYMTILGHDTIYPANVHSSLSAGCSSAPSFSGAGGRRNEPRPSSGVRGCEIILLVGLEGMTYDEAAVTLKGDYGPDGLHSGCELRR